MIYNLALIGYPVGHSLSPQIHTDFLKKSQLNGGYICIEAEPQNLEKAIRALQTLKFKGVNLTIPHKQDGMKIADTVSEEAKLIGAANTLIFKPDGEIHAENTDWIGFLDSLPKEIQEKIKRVAILGAGGSARAVITALLKLNVKEISLFIRDSKSSNNNAHSIRDSVDNQSKSIHFLIENIQDFSGLDMNFDLVVNTTPIGMRGMEESKSPVPGKFFDAIKNKNCYVYDLIYNPSETHFMKLAKANEFETQNGYRMLYLQAAHAFSLWTEMEVKDLI